MINNVPAWAKKGCIYSGYRKHTELAECFRSIVMLHNETINIWTHLSGFLLYLNVIYVNYRTSRKKEVLIDVYIISSMFTLATSTVYHLTTASTEKIHNFMLKLDLLTIILQISVCLVTVIHLWFWCYPTISSIYIGISLSCGLVVAYIPLSNVLVNNHKLVKVIFFIYVSSGFIPLFHAMLIYYYDRIDNSLYTYDFTLSMFYNTLGFVIYSSKFPEIILPGKFDIVGNSHQIWHILIFMGNYEHYKVIDRYYAFRSDYICPSNRP